MQLIHGLDAMTGSLTPSAVTVGNFDGVHRGHRALLDGVVAAARARGLSSLAMTFDPHPAAILAPERAPRLLMPVERRIELMAQSGLDGIVLQPFDRAFSNLTAAQFLDRVLRTALGARCLVVGPDFRFGAGRRGTAETLSGSGLDVVRVPQVSEEGRPISSSRIRDVVASGDVRLAGRLLGHPHEIIGKVIKGDGRGRKMGVPTANLDLETMLGPADGVYAGRVDLAEGSFLAVVNIGVRPTVSAGRAVEVHLLDFDGPLHGLRLVVRLDRRLREERRFPSLDALKEQIARDIEDARTP